jgi:preprotein translocase SecE subunit
VVRECKRVTWPTRRSTSQLARLIVMVLLVTMVALAVLDIAFAQGISWLIQS